MKLHEHPELASILRLARAQATSLRNALEEVESQAQALDDDEVIDSIEIGEFADKAGDIEDWLDGLPINEDGSSAL